MVLSVDNTLGALFIAVVIASNLHGVSWVQAVYYFTHQNDSWHLKLLVSAVMIFDTIHQILISHGAYTYLVTNYDNPASLQYIVWSMEVEIFFNGFIAFLVQGFMTVRVWRLSNRNPYITAVILLLVLGEFGCVLAYSGMSLSIKTFVEIDRLRYVSILINALAAAGDVLITAVLCILLNRSRTGFQRSDTLINNLILFAVNTGVFTSLCAIASLATFVVQPQTFLYIAFFFCMGRFYTNSLLATLNARKLILVASQGIRENGSYMLREYHADGRIPSMPPPNISIKVDTTHELTCDFKFDEPSCENERPNTSPGSVGSEETVQV